MKQEMKPIIRIATFMNMLIDEKDIPHDTVLAIGQDYLLNGFGVITNTLKSHGYKSYRDLRIWSKNGA